MLLGTDCDTNAAFSASGVGVFVGATVVPTGVRVKVGVGGGSDGVGCGGPGAPKSMQPAFGTTWGHLALAAGRELLLQRGRQHRVHDVRAGLTGACGPRL